MCHNSRIKVRSPLQRINQPQPQNDIFRFKYDFENFKHIHSFTFNFSSQKACFVVVPYLLLNIKKC